MTNLEKYNQVFVDTLDITPDELNDNLTMESVDSWDSVKNLALLGALENEFGISWTFDEMMDLNSYKKGKEILAAKGIEF